MSSSKQVKIQQRLRLSKRINREGVEMPACSHCSRQGTKCVVSGDSRRCSECVTRNARCDYAGPSVQDWVKLQREEDRLVAAGAVAEEQAMAAHRLADEAHRSIVRAHRSADEAISRMRRIRLQQKLLKERGGEMLRRGLATLDELDEVEREERGEVVAASSSEHAARTASASKAALDLLSMPSPAIYHEPPSWSRNTSLAQLRIQSFS